MFHNIQSQNVLFCMWIHSSLFMCVWMNSENLSKPGSYQIAVFEKRILDLTFGNFLWSKINFTHTHTQNK